ncbi:hypothetical protein [Oceanospirillum sediminis]|uniref:Uncharacterized protein n=1 Tax=Oceanospirillum sediminis TaxID=2760088 RepID=A0A839IMH4_9GAMM|nr:hypothetical protein [Oceanospirillum sediminis]MBB1485920.1 hypothetical protein [Oceanospirillum sediminis]
MRVNIYSDFFTPVPVKGQYLHIKIASGDVEVRFSDQTRLKLSAGETIEIAFDGLEFKSGDSDQEIEIRTGWGKFQPAITAITSTAIERINRPVDVTGSTVAITGQADVTGSKVDVSGSAVTVSGSVDVSGSTLNANVNGAVEVVGSRSASVIGAEITIPPSGSASIAARNNRSRIILQNDSEALTKCRVTEADAVSPYGLRLIGGDGMMGEQILRTTAALKIWNTSETVAVISIFEEVV